MTRKGSKHRDRRYTLGLVGAGPRLIRQSTGIASQTCWDVKFCEKPDQMAAWFDAGAKTQISLVLVEATTPEDTTELIRKVRSCMPDVPVVAILSPISALTLIPMMRAGVSGFLTQPLSAESLLRLLREVQSGGVIEAMEFPPLQEERDGCIDLSSLTGNDSSFRELLARAAIAARGEGHVLIGGERGTGKKRLAQAILAASQRALLPSRSIDLRNLATGNVGPALWGHERGAFPGAFERRGGLLQDCDGGTLLLDGLDRLPASHQQSLAETLKHSYIRPLGADYGFRANVRILAISHRPLRDLVESGAVVAELYDLLSVTELNLPPLRERSGDVALLARHFLTKFVSEGNMNDLSFSQDAVNLLEAYDWPGNIRQLQAVILRAAAVSEDRMITSRSFLNLFRHEQSGPSFGVEVAAPLLGLDNVNLYASDGHIRTLGEIELDVIRLAIKRYGGQASEAARRLGIGRSTLYRKLAELDLEEG